MIEEKSVSDGDECVSSVVVCDGRRGECGLW